MKFLLALLFIIVTAAGSHAQTTDENAILDVLKKQTAAWNRGDLDAFMIGYWQNDSLLFIGKSGITYGYQKTLENYKKGYGDTARMGTFTSTILHMKKMAADSYFIIGKWHLKRSVGDASGHYSLVMRKIKGQWVIVADHSS
jgi:ketosteroid isomerase-like protein